MSNASTSNTGNRGTSDQQGNGGNWPSTKGGKISGKGRGNAPPKSK